MSDRQTIDRHVLMLDDEELFLRFGAIPFRTGFCGFCTWHVHPFSDPHEALDFYAKNAETVDVVLTDQHMPKMSGVEFINHLRAIPTGRSDMTPILIVSSDPPRQSLLPQRVTAVAKPYTKDDIAHALCDVSVVCETGKCGHEKPKPASELKMRDIYGQLPVYG